MHLDFQISESDYVAAAQLYQRTRNTFTRVTSHLVIASRFLRVIVVVILFVFAELQGRRTQPVAAIAAVLLLPMLRIFYQRSQLAARYRANPAIQQENSLDIDARGLVNSDSAGTKLRPWAEFSRLEESRSTFILCKSTSTGFLIMPKRQMTAEQIEEYRRIVRMHLRSGIPGSAPLTSQPNIGLTGR